MSKKTATFTNTFSGFPTPSSVLSVPASLGLTLSSSPSPSPSPNNSNPPLTNLAPSNAKDSGRYTHKPIVKLFAVFKLFSTETVLPIPQEPSHVTSTGDCFVVATKTGKIHVFSLIDDKIIENSHFYTVNPTILDLKYMPATDFLVTIEKESSQSEINVIRVYSDWRWTGPLKQSVPIVEPPHSISPPSSRGPSPVPSKHHSDDEDAAGSNENVKVQNYTLALPNSIQHISVCKERSLVALCTETTVLIYDITKQKKEFIFEIQQPRVLELAIYSDYIAFLTKTEVFVLNIKLETKTTSSLNTSLTSLAQNFLGSKKKNTDKAKVKERDMSVAEKYIKLINSNQVKGEKKTVATTREDAYYVETFFDTLGKPTNIVPFMNLFIESIGNPTCLPIPSTSEDEVLGPIKQSLKIDLNPNYMLVSSVLVLYKRFLEGCEIHSLHLLPEYGEKYIDTDVPNESTVKNDSFNKMGEDSPAENRKKLIGVRCFLSSETEGYMYDVLNKTQLVATFTYVTATYKVGFDNLFLYSFNDDGLTITTIRSTFTRYFNMYCPMWIGQSESSGLVQLCAGDGHLVLLSKQSEADLQRRLIEKLPTTMSPSAETFKLKNRIGEKEDNSVGWKVVVFQAVNTIELYTELFQKAIQFQEDNAGVYIQLLLEGHYLLLNKVAMYNSTNYVSEEEKAVKRMLRSSYTLLGDFFAKIENNYKLAALCYVSSDTLISDALRCLKDDEVLTFYLNHVLFDPEMKELLSQDATLQNSIIEHYSRHCPKYLGKVILESSLSKYNLDKAIRFLDMAKMSDTYSLNEIYLALTLLNLEKELYKVALLNLTKLPESLVVYHCVNNPKLLLPEPKSADVNILSLGMALREKAPWALIEVLVQLRKSMKYKDAKSILMTTKAEASNESLNLNKLLVLCYTEAVVLETLGDKDINDENDKEKPKSTKESEKTRNFVNLMICLSQLYMDMMNLSDFDLSVFFQELNAVVNLNERSDAPEKTYESIWKQFHLEVFLENRSEYLDKLPPFDPKNPFMRGRASSDKWNQHFYLRKLQGLLCIPSASNSSRLLEYVKSKLQEKINHQTETFFSFSLLCHTEDRRLTNGLELLFSKFSDIILEFSKQYCKKALDWDTVLGAILAHIIGSSGEKKLQLYSSYEDVLKHLSLTLEPDEFIKILPDGGNVGFFLPYIRSCFHHHNAKKLITDIKVDAEIESDNYT